MKKILAPVLFFLFVLGIAAVAKAEMTYGPLVLDDASVLPKGVFEIIGFYSHAAPTLELVSPVGPAGKRLTTEVDLPVSAITGAVSYGLTDEWELGMSVNKVSRDYFNYMDRPSSSAVTGNISGMGDLLLKAKTGNGKVAGSLVIFLPTAEDGIITSSTTSNDTDIAFKLALTPVKDTQGALHLNLGLTKWGKDDTPKLQSTTIDYGLAGEFFLGRNKKSTITVELAGNTLKGPSDKTPLDFYTGFRVSTSEKFQFNLLLALGCSEGSSLGEWELGYGLGFKWLLG